jgi:hypothetical protein
MLLTVSGSVTLRPTAAVGTITTSVIRDTTRTSLSAEEVVEVELSTKTGLPVEGTEDLIVLEARRQQARTAATAATTQAILAMTTTNMRRHISRCRRLRIASTQAAMTDTTTATDGNIIRMDIPTTATMRKTTTMLRDVKVDRTRLSIVDVMQCRDRTAAASCRRVPMPTKAPRISQTPRDQCPGHRSQLSSSYQATTLRMRTPVTLAPQSHKLRTMIKATSRTRLHSQSPIRVGKMPMRILHRAIALECVSILLIIFPQ